MPQRALVRLANTSVLKKDVEAFRTKYPTWENDLVKILKVLGKKQQKKDELAKKKKRSEVKLKKKAEKLPKSDPKNEDKSDSEIGEPKVNEVNDQIRSFFFLKKKLKSKSEAVKKLLKKHNIRIHKKQNKIILSFWSFS